MELFDVNPAERAQYNVSVPSWCSFLEPSRILRTRLSPVFAYGDNFGHVKAGPDLPDQVRVHERAGIMSVAISEFVVVVFMHLWMTARETVTCGRCVDSRLRHIVHDVDRPTFLGAGPLCRPLPVPLGPYVAGQVHDGRQF